MRLIEEAEFDRIKQKQIRDYNPQLKAMADIQTSIDNFLMDSTLGYDEKLPLINYLNGKFNSLFQATRNTLGNRSEPLVIPTPALAANAPPPSAAAAATDSASAAAPTIAAFSSSAQEGPEKSTPLPTTIDAKIPGQYAKKYNDLLQFLQNQQAAGVIERTTSNEMRINGELIPNSSFTDLMRGLYTRNQTMNYTGENKFLQALSTLKLPTTLISNKDALAKLEGLGVGVLGAHTKSNKASLETVPSASKLADTDIAEDKGKQEGRGLLWKQKNPIMKFIKAPPGNRPKILRLYRL